ncbi:MAG: GNAT family N-acetyltransferase [Alphaproteobacteria bacterium]|nr:GNAT family N-acetyltransferase [Alphaproteobacteria bacterium]
MVNDGKPRSEPLVRPLDPIADRQAVLSVFKSCADYVLLETGEEPGEANVTEFFEEVAPGLRVADALKLGVFDHDERLVGLIDIGPGYPEAGDWYLGLMMIDARFRNRGLGRQALNWVLDAARKAGAERLLLCVLEENPQGRAFWEREGFVLRRTTPPWTAGTKTHVRFELERPVQMTPF